jgi:hypothetical protein
MPQIIEDSSQGDPVLQIGGGVTLDISRALGVRVAVAHRRAFLDGGNGGATRIAAGAVVRF